VITVPDEIQTARMLLRKPCVADAPLMFRAYAQDPGSNPLSDLAPHMEILQKRAR